MNVHKWPKDTVLISGSSIIQGLQENRMNKKYNVKIRPFSGASVGDMYDYLSPLLKKEPSCIILQIGSNDSPYKSSGAILDEILLLKCRILQILPSVKIVISCPIVRFDNAKAGLTLRRLDDKLKSLNLDIVINDNIDGSCLGKRGLHLNPKGSGRLAINFLSVMRQL